MTGVSVCIDTHIRGGACVKVFGAEDSLLTREGDVDLSVALGESHFARSSTVPA